MTPNRWTLALDSDQLSLPPGPVLVLGARAGADLAPLGDVLAVTGSFPDHLALSCRGFAVATEVDDRAYAAALVQIGKSKPANLGLVVEALASVQPGGVVLVDGQKTEGIESLLKGVKAVLPVDDVFSKSHGKLFWLTRPDALPPEIETWRIEPQDIGGYVTAPGMFSADGPDPGSEMLVALVPKLKGRVADLGAGWGYLASEILDEQGEIAAMDLIEADWPSLQAAMTNVTDDRAEFVWADATTYSADEPYDAIISNPPFHSGREADPSLGRAFIAAAARNLKPGGRFFMVANRHLPYEAALKEAFGTGRMLGELQGYKLYEAARPKGRRR